MNLFMDPKEKEREKSYLTNYQKARLILAAALVASTSIPKEVKAQECSREPIPMVEPLRAYGPYSSEEEMLNNQNPTYSPVCYQLEVGDNISVELDEDESIPLGEYEFPSLSKYSLESIENINENNIIKTEQNTLIYFIPLDLNNDIVDSSEVKQFVVKPGMNFEVAQKRVLIDKEGNKIEIQLLGNTFGGKNFVAAILTGIEKKGFERSSLVSNNSEKIEDVSTYIVTKDSVYPNKILNILKAFGYLTDVGQLKKDEIYYYISIIGLDNREMLKSYENGRNSGGSVVTAGGVCATATALSSLLYHVEGVEIYPLGVGRWTHPGPYAQGPFSPYWKEVDATVAYNREAGMRFDFIWKMNRNGYIKIDPQIFPTDVDFSATDEDGLGHISDVNAIISLGFTEDEPIGQKENLQNLWERYFEYRESKHKQPLPMQNELKENSFSQTEDVKRAMELLYLIKEPEESQH